MVIAFEGLMRVGKTSTIRALRERHPGLRVVKEVSLSEPAPSSGDGGAPAYYIRNDRLKGRLAAQAAADQVVLLDRYFLSTVLYRLAEREGLAPDAGLARARIASVFPGIPTPDLWILVREAPRASWERAHRQVGERLDGAWRELPFVERLAAWYDVVFRSLAEEGDMGAAYVVPSGPPQRVMRRVERILRERVTTPAFHAVAPAGRGRRAPAPVPEGAQ
jgi:thymidylate kinase